MPPEFQLEDAKRLGLVQEVVGFAIVERQIVQSAHQCPWWDHVSQVLRMTGLGNVFRPRKSILRRPTRSPNGIHRVLRDQSAASSFTLEGKEINERLVADDHARGM